MKVMATKSFEKLESWRKAMRYVEHIYRVTQHFPADEKSGLTASLRRSATAIPAKIAEAHDQNDLGDYKKALGVLREIHTHLALSRRLGYLGWYRMWDIRSKTDDMAALLEKIIAQQTESKDRPAQGKQTQRKVLRTNPNSAHTPRPMEVVVEPPKPGIIAQLRRRLMSLPHR